ncbi:hypothetical protein [Alkalihalobacillus sp. CinArs1]|uniref:hypothetical protein n=1 Tax=Alkalihalobacillus sp. CinArs1 TaxID=2995314 RepID=UPI0022DDEC7F|nr:hypothetical protein [Alkalihalobacillus sp. CinArs1]
MESSTLFRKQLAHKLFVTILISSYFVFGILSFFEAEISKSPILTTMFSIVVIIVGIAVVYFIKLAMKKGRAAVVGLLAFYLFFLVTKVIIYVAT